MNNFMVDAREALIPGGAYDRSRPSMTPFQNGPNYGGDSFVRHDQLGFIAQGPERGFGAGMGVNLPVPMGMLSGWRMPPPNYTPQMNGLCFVHTDRICSKR